MYTLNQLAIILIGISLFLTIFGIPKFPRKKETTPLDTSDGIFHGKCLNCTTPKTMDSSVCKQCFYCTGDALDLSLHQEDLD